MDANEKCINTESFNTIEIKFFILNEKGYKIQWHSKMTGATTTFYTFDQETYVVVRNWSMTKQLPNFDMEFDNSKTAFKHFLHNVDVVKLHHEVVKRAKMWATDFYTQQQGLPKMENPNFLYSRLQGGIGMGVNIYDKSTKDHLIAKGYLLQLIGTKAQVQISERFALRTNKNIQSFPTQQVALI